MKKLAESDERGERFLSDNISAQTDDDGGVTLTLHFSDGGETWISLDRLALDKLMAWHRASRPLLILGGAVEVDDAAVPRCDTCRWWRPDPQDAPLKVVGVCAAASTAPLEKRDSRAAVSDGAQLVTLPDFGCVQWEAKRDE